MFQSEQIHTDIGMQEQADTTKSTTFRHTQVAKKRSTEERRYKTKLNFKNLLNHIPRKIGEKNLQINTYGNVQTASSEIKVYFHRDNGLLLQVRWSFSHCIFRQGCILEGCVPPACSSYAGGLVNGWGCLPRGGCLPRSAWRGGVCPGEGRGCLEGEGSMLAHGRQTPSRCEQNDRQM